MKIAGVVLAAGASSRLGFPKQLVQFDGETLVRRASRAVLLASFSPVVVVVGANSDRVIDEIAGLPVTPVSNPDWASGMASSIHAGLRAALKCDSEVTAVLFTLCDQPLVSDKHLMALAALFSESRQPIAAAAYNATCGVPAIFGKPMYPRLLALHGEAGARKVICANLHNVAQLPLPAAAFDIDTEADLDAVRSSIAKPAAHL